MEMRDYQNLQGMDSNQQMLYMVEINNRRKSHGAAFALAVILGPWASRLYLREYGFGVLLLVLQIALLFLFSVHLVFPLLFLCRYLWELSQVGKLVRVYNDQVTTEVAAGMSSLKRPEAPSVRQ